MLRLIRQLFSKRWFLSVCSVGVTLTLLLLPNDSVEAPEMKIPHLDKIAHVCLFAACAFSLMIDFRVKPMLPKEKRLFYIALFVATLFLGFFTEIIQEQYLNRTFSYSDVVADFVGVFLGVLVGHSFLYEFYFKKIKIF